MQKDVEDPEESPPWNDDSSDGQLDLKLFDHWTQKLRTWGVESRGVRPVPIEERTDKQIFKIFFVFFTMNFNILSFSSGTLAPAVFGLGLRDSCLCILFFELLCCAPPAYLTTWGPKLGMRQMIASRYTFGFYGIILPSILNLIGLCGFCILSCILGGQALASAANGQLTWTVGIVIISIISLLVSFCGMKVLLWYERIAWIPVLVSFLVALGVGGKHFSNPEPSTPATAAAVLSFGSTIAGFSLSYSSLSSDFTTYYHPKASRRGIFLYTYFGLLLSTVPIQLLGAAAAIAATYVDSWGTGYQGGNVGGLLAAMLSPTGRFGKFLTVLLSLSVAGNIAATFYSFCLNVQVFMPFLVVVPRYVFSIVATAIVIPLSIVGAHRFYDTLENFLGLIGYWAGTYIGIVLVEHFIFRRNDFEQYNVRNWDKARLLPSGLAAIGAGITSFGLVVPCMAQAWYTGPIAKVTGDIGFEVAFVLGAILYIPFRALEIKIRRSL